jgi:hypothetical protein
MDDEAAKTGHALRIQSGQSVYERPTTPVPLIDVKGTHGFRLASTFEGPFGPVGSCQPCVPGDALLLASTSLGTDLRGTVTLHGETYDRLGGASIGDPQINIEFDGENLVVPPFTDAGMAEVSGPFTFSGQFSYYPEEPTGPAVTETLSGRGIATVRLRTVDFGGETVWIVAGAVYEFTR